MRIHKAFYILNTIDIFFRVLCSPCQRETLDIEATKFCRSCKDPEPLCDVCAQIHTRRRETKEHKISDDFEKIAILAAKHKYDFTTRHAFL